MESTNSLQKTIYNMLTYSTGRHPMDSGGVDNRHWQRNQKKTIQDFIAEPRAELDSLDWEVEQARKNDEDFIESEELVPTLNVFHFLTEDCDLEMDNICHDYNSLDCEDWDSELYGVSEKQYEWLENHGFNVSDPETYNTYNGESLLSQVLQFHLIKHEGNGDYYVLLQIHNGADIRGGYTDAVMFKPWERYNLLSEFVGADVVDIEGETRHLDTAYNGYSLTENGESVKVDIEKIDEIELY